MTLEISFLPSTSMLFHAVCKDVMISLVENLLLLSPGSYSLAYPRDRNSFLHFLVTVVDSLVSVDIKLQHVGNYLPSILHLQQQNLAHWAVLVFRKHVSFRWVSRTFIVFYYFFIIYPYLLKNVDHSTENIQACPSYLIAVLRLSRKSHIHPSRHGFFQISHPVQIRTEFFKLWFLTDNVAINSIYTLCLVLNVWVIKMKCVVTIDRERILPTLVLLWFWIPMYEINELYFLSFFCSLNIWDYLFVQICILHFYLENFLFC